MVTPLFEGLKQLLVAIYQRGYVGFILSAYV